LLTSTGYSQSFWKDHYTVSTNFNPDDTKTYHVSQVYRSDNPVATIRFDIATDITFVITDTFQGGYKLNYAVTSSLETDDQDAISQLVSLVVDGLELNAIYRDGHFQPDSSNYFQEKQRMISKLDSITSRQSYGKATEQSISFLRKTLSEKSGLEILLAPLRLFETYQSSGSYKKYGVPGIKNNTDIFHQPLFEGRVIQQWKRTSKDSTVELSYQFTADPNSAARYFRSIYEPQLNSSGLKKGDNFFPEEVKYTRKYEFRTKADAKFPTSLQEKTTERYAWLTVDKVKMSEPESLRSKFIYN